MFNLGVNPAQFRIVIVKNKNNFAPTADTTAVVTNNEPLNYDLFRYVKVLKDKTINPETLSNERYAKNITLDYSFPINEVWEYASNTTAVP